MFPLSKAKWTEFLAALDAPPRLSLGCSVYSQNRASLTRHLHQTLRKNVDEAYRKLQPHHPLEAFDCGQEALNGFLKKHARQNQHSGGSQTYVGLADETVIGYYALAVGLVEQQSE